MSEEGGKTIMATRKECLEELLEIVQDGWGCILVVSNVEIPNIPTIHNFYPKKYCDSIKHYGLGLFGGRTERGEFSFDAGGAMHNLQYDGGYLAWSPLRASAEVLKDLGYDIKKVERALKAEIERENKK